MGDRPITRDAPADVRVTVDPSVPGTEPTLACEGAGTSAIMVCESPVRWFAPGLQATGDALRLTLRPNQLFGEWIYLEIVPGPVPFARAFMRYENDYTPDYPLACESAHTPDVILSGAATLSTLEPGEEVHGRIDLILSTGGTITASF
jgi:hypothetical protein